MGLLKSGRKVWLVTDAIAHYSQIEGERVIRDFVAAGGQCTFVGRVYIGSCARFLTIPFSILVLSTTMRSLRWLLLVAMVLIATAVFGIYRAQRVTRRSQRRPVPPSIPLDTKTMAPDWEWSQSSDNGMPAVKISAKNMKQSADSTRAELVQIELHIYQKDGLHYDRVKSDYAQLTTSDHKLYSPGDAEITLDVPVQGEPPHQLTSITGSGINFDSVSGQAVTDKHVSFTFEEGDGTGTGATYDPATHSLNLNNNVVSQSARQRPERQADEGRSRSAGLERNDRGSAASSLVAPDSRSDRHRRGPKHRSVEGPGYRLDRRRSKRMAPTSSRASRSSIPPTPST